MSIRAVPVQRAVGGAAGSCCVRLRQAMYAAFFILLGVLALRPFCVPDFAAGYGGTRAPAGLGSWAVPGGMRIALREKGSCSLGFKPGAILTTAQVGASGILPIASFAPLAPAPDGASVFARARVSATAHLLPDLPLLAYYARSARILR